MPRRLLQRTIPAVGLFLVAALATAAPTETGTAAGALGSPAVQRALAAVDEGLSIQLDEWEQIAGIPAPSGSEARRAAFVRRALLSLGLEVRTDAVGNVSARLQGHGDGPTVVLAAHMDSVREPGPESIERGPSRIRGPGVLDNAGGVATLLATARAWTHGGVRGSGSLVLLATVQEETGFDGIRHWLDRRGDEVDALVAIDSRLGPVRYGALGIYWSRLVFEGGGGHTMGPADRPHPARAAAATILRLYEIAAASSDAFLNVGEIRGGHAVNALPEAVSLSVDLRAREPEALDRLDGEIVNVAMRAAREHGVEFHREWIQRSPPVAADAPMSGLGQTRLVRTAVDVIRTLDIDTGGGPAAIPVGSCDSNAGLAAGIASICVGYAYGGDHHGADEWADLGSARLGTRQIVLLAAALVGVEEGAGEAVGGGP